MKIKLEKVGAAVGIGVVDEVAEYFDNKQGWTGSFRNSTDIVRLVGSLAGLGMTAFDFYPTVGEAIYPSFLTLLTKSIAKPVKSAMGISGVGKKARGRVLTPAGITQRNVADIIAQSEADIPVVTGDTILA